MTSRILSAAVLTLALGTSSAYPAKAKSPPKAEVAQPAAPVKPAEAPARHVKVGVTEAGFEPSEIPAKVGENLVLDITRVTDETCATAIVIPDQKVKVDLPLNKEVQVPVKASAAGRVAFACPMNMITGAIVVSP